MADNYFSRFDDQEESDPIARDVPTEGPKNYFSVYDSEPDNVTIVTKSPPVITPPEQSFEQIPGVSWVDRAYETMNRDNAERKRKEKEALDTKRGNSFLEGIADPQQYGEFAKGIIPGAVRFTGTTLKGAAGLQSSSMQASKTDAERQLAILDSLDRGEQPADATGFEIEVSAYQGMTPEQRQAYRERLAGFASPVTATEDRTLFKAGQKVTDFAETILPADPAYREAVGRQLGEGIGSMIAGLPARFLGRIPALAFFGSGGSGEAVERAIQHDKQLRKEGKPGLTEQQIATSALWGVAPGATDLLPVEVLLGRLKIPQPFRKPFAQAIGRIGGQAFIEGLQEGGQAFLQNVIAQQVYNPEQQVGEGILPEAGLGAGVGAIAETSRQIIARFAGRRGGGAPVQSEDDLTIEELAEAIDNPMDQGQQVARETKQDKLDVQQPVEGAQEAQTEPETGVVEPEATDTRAAPNAVQNELNRYFNDAIEIDDLSPESQAVLEQLTPEERQAIFRVQSRAAGLYGIGEESGATDLLADEDLAGLQREPSAEEQAAIARLAELASEPAALPITPEELQAAEQEIILPAIEEVDSEIGSPVIAEAYSRLTPDEKSEIISRISENEEDIADLIEEMAIRNEDLPTIAAMAMRRGATPEQIQQLRSVIQQASPELATVFDELVASLPKPRQASQTKKRAAPALSQERQAAASDYASRLQSSIDDKSSFDAVLASANKALKKPELEAAAREFLGYDATFRTKAEAVNALKKRQADWVIGGAQTETIARDFDEAVARREQQAQPRAQSTEQRVSDAYWRMTQRPQDWVPMRELRAALPDVSRADLDAAIKSMYLSKAINVSSEDDQGSLTQADRDASFRLGPTVDSARVDKISMQKPVRDQAAPQRSVSELRNSFASILNSKTPKSKWASELGVTEAELAPLIEDAVRKGFLRRDKNGNVRRVPQSQRPSSFAAMVVPDNLPETMPGEGDVALTTEAEEVWAEAKAAINRAASAILPAAVKVDVVDNIAIAALKKEDQILALSRRVISEVDEATVNRLERNTEAISNFLESEAFSAQPDGIVDIPASVMAHVFEVTQNQEVLGAIVRSLPVNVVNFFVRKKVPTERALGDESVFKDVFAIDGESSITFPIDVTIATPLLRTIADNTAELADLTRRSLEQDATGLAVSADTILRGHARNLGVKSNISSGVGDNKVALIRKTKPSESAIDEADNIRTELDRIDGEIRKLSAGLGAQMRIPSAEREASMQRLRKERGELIETYAKLPLEARAARDQMLALRAFHGSPHDFDRFDISRIGTGEGAQAFGHGLYFAENELVARSYQNVLAAEGITLDGEAIAGDPELMDLALTKLSGQNLEGQSLDDYEQIARSNLERVQSQPEPTEAEASRYFTTVEAMRARQAANLEAAQDYLAKVQRVKAGEVKSPGQLYEVEIDVEPEQLLDWDKPLGYQSVQASTAIRKLQDINPNQFRKPEIERWLAGASEFFSVDRFYDIMRGDFGGVENLNAAFKEVGIPGIRYLDQGSRGTGEGTRNIVIFDDSLVKITKKNGKPVSTAERKQVVDQMFALRGFHSSPYDFNRFDMSKIGAGEGAQAFGWGLYFADSEKVAGHYALSVPDQQLLREARDAYDEFEDPDSALELLLESPTLTEPQKRFLSALAKDDWFGFDYPHQAVRAALRDDPKNWDASQETLDAIKGLSVTYEVDIKADEKDFLDWDKPVTEQPLAEKIGDIWFRGNPKAERADLVKQVFSGWTGRDLYKQVARGFGNDEAASKYLAQNGIAGIRYLDQASRRKGEGTRNTVVFDDKIIEITHKDGKPVSAEERQGVVDQMFALNQPSQEQVKAAKALQELAKTDEAFVYPRSDKEDVVGVLNDVAAGPEGFEHQSTNELGFHEHGANRIHNFLTSERKPFHVYEDDNRVWIDVSEVKQGQAGSAIYAAVANYALNTGRKFVGDPDGMSAIALRRRTENMLSSALKFGTTDHLAPHEDQLAGNEKIGVPPLQWTEGDTLANIASLMEVSVESVASKFPEIKDYRYDLATGTVRTGEGQPVSARMLDELAESSPEVRASRAGRRTLARVILQHTLLQESRGEAGAGLLGEIVSRSAQQNQPGAMSEGIFYAQSRQAEALGQTDPYTMTISIAMRAVEAEAKAKGVSTVQEAVRVLRHEAVEFFKAMGLFTEKEWNVLKTAAKRNGWVETTGVREAYEAVYKGGMSETEMNDLLIKEAIAEQYSEFHLGKKQFKGVVAEVFQRIKDFIDRTASFMRGEGFQTWSDVFESIDQGEFKARFEEAFPEMVAQPRTDTAAMQATAGKIPDSPARRATAGTERPAQSLADLVNAFNKALGLTVRQGRIDPGLKRAAAMAGGDVRGQTSMATGVVRLRVPNEIDTLAHEGGHALENRFKGDLEAIKQAHAAELTPLASPGPDALSEGFAEWFRRYVTNPAASKRTAPGFEQAFEDFLDAQDPAMLASLQSIRDGYQEWIKAPSGGAVASSIATTVAPGSTKEIIREFKEEGLRNTFQNWTDRIYTAVFDDLHPMRLAVDGLLEIAKKNVKPSLRKNLDVKATDNAYKLLRLARDGYAAGHMDIMHGVHGYKDITPQGPGLRDALVTAFTGSAQGRAGILDPARRMVGIQPKADWSEAVATDFGAYLVSRRMVQEWARFQNGDISAPPDKFSLADHQQSIKDFEAKYPGFAQGAQQVYEYLNNMLRKKRDAGLITSELYDELVGRRDYVPVMRDMSDRGSVEGRSAARKDKYSIISRFRGSQRDVINPLESIAKDSYETAMIIARNDALKALDALARAAGPDGGKFAERLPAREMKATQVNLQEAIRAASRDAGIDPADMQIMLQAVDDQLGDNTVAQIWRAGEISEKGEAIVYLWENGERIPIRLADGQFGHDMLHAVTGLNREAEGWFVNLFSLPSTALRVGVTASLDFVLANYVRDQLSAWVLTRDFIPFYDGARGVYNDLTMKDVSRIYSRVGGIMGGANVAAQHESRVKRELLQLRRKGVRFTLNPLTRDFWRMTEFSEAGTRLAVFQKAFDRAKTDGLTDWEASVEAAFIARDYIDFGRRGSRMLPARKLIPFFNAALQGLDRGIRGLKGSVDADKVLRTVISPYIKSRTGQPLTEVEQGNMKQAVQAWGYMATLGLLGLGLSLLYKDDEEFEEISDYIKATHWLIRIDGEWVRIPKPFELAFFSNLLERTFDYVYKDDPTAVERFISGLFEITVPPHSAPGFAVTTELITDYNFFTGRPIVGPFLKSLPPELQFNAYASEFSKYLGKQVGISPAYIDHFITGFGASYGREFVNASDMFMPALGKATDGAFGLPTGPVADPALQDYFFIRRFTTDPTRGSNSVRQFWNMMSMENGTFIQAANGYRHLVDKVRDVKGAQEFLERLPDEERAYALLMAGNTDGRAKYRRLHPMERAKEITSVASGMKKEINLNRLYKGGDGKQIELTPQQMRTVSDLLSDITMREARNALIALGVRGWEQKKPIEVDTVYEELKAAAPDVHKEIVDRLKSKKLPSYIDVVKGWPIARERILEDGQKAIITDLYRRDFSIGQGAPLQ